MATSRTGTAKWKRIRTQALRHAHNTGVTHCSLCRTPLDWTRSKTPASPEPDHIIEHTNGGTDTLDNLRIICRQCNQRRGGKLGRQKQLTKHKPRRTQFTGELATSQTW